MKLAFTAALLGAGFGAGAVVDDRVAPPPVASAPVECPAPVQVDVPVRVACPTVRCPAPEPAEAHDVAGLEGILLDEEGEPAPGRGVIATLGSQTTRVTTDDAGRFVFDLPAGSFKLEVDSCDLETAIDELALSAGERLSGIDLKCRGITPEEKEQERLRKESYSRAAQCSSRCRDEHRKRVPSDCIAAVETAKRDSYVCSRECDLVAGREIANLSR